MSSRAERQIGLDDAIIVDEIGLESGCYGLYRLRSLYQPIFKRREKTLKMIAVEATTAAFVANEQVPAEVFLSAVADDDHDFIGRMSLALALRNHKNIGVDTLELVVDPEGADQETLVDRIRLVVEELDGAGLDASRVVCALGQHAASDMALLSRLAQEMRSHRLLVAVGDFGVGHWTDQAIDILRPEVVRIDGEWFRQVCRDATTVRLFEAVVSRLRERSSKVLVTGIETPVQLAVALQAGVDLLQGGHLAVPVQVGMEIDERPLSIAERLGEVQRIVPLFG